MADVFIGSEALAHGALTRGQLRWRYRTIFPDVYIAKSAMPTQEQYVVGAWLWSRRRGVIAGIAAAERHGAQWFDQSAPVELVLRCSRPPPGIVTRNERIDVDEIIDVDGVPVTTPERTALDIARRLPCDSAVSHLDAVARATGIRASDVWPLVDRYAGVHGSTRAIIALSLMDGGSASARQSQLRLALIDGGLPPPMTHIKVTDGDTTAFVDMGYQGPMVGVVCGDRASDLLARMGWTIIHARDSHTPPFIAHRVKSELRRRGHVLSTLRRQS
jgi:hypothetical protein